MNRPGPLGDDHLSVINQALRTLHDVVGEADRAESCGWDCQNVRQQARSYEAILTKVKQVYFPGEP